MNVMTDVIQAEDDTISTKTSRSIAPSWLSWTKYSEMLLRSIEKNILSYLKTTYRGWYVDIGPVVGPSDKIWTISLNTESQNTPLVLLHGLGAGVALWCLNLDAFSANRPVYAIDLLGFGRSSRPAFNKDANIAEKEMVRSIEEWRRELKLEKFILLGHSLGGFLATSYALSYPERIKHLILADPWGFTERPQDLHPSKPTSIWLRAIAYTLSPFNPFAAVRMAGPFGQWLVGKLRSDINRKYARYIQNEELITQYIYQCNSRPPSGETAFHYMMKDFGWAKNPMIKRIHNMDKSVPLTVLYGSKSWMDFAGEMIKEKLMDSYVQIEIVHGAGHHVFSDKPEIFNKYVVDACNYTDGLKSTQSEAILPTPSNNKENVMEEKEDQPSAITPDA